MAKKWAQFYNDGKLETLYVGFKNDFNERQVGKVYCIGGHFQQLAIAHCRQENWDIGCDQPFSQPATATTWLSITCPVLFGLPTLLIHPADAMAYKDSPTPRSPSAAQSASGRHSNSHTNYSSAYNQKRSSLNDKSQNQPDSQVLDETVVSLKARYATELADLRQIFSDWSDSDLLTTLDEAYGDLELAIGRISEGTNATLLVLSGAVRWYWPIFSCFVVELIHVNCVTTILGEWDFLNTGCHASVWGEVTKTRKKADKPKAKDSPAGSPAVGTSAAATQGSDSRGRQAFGGRGRGGGIAGRGGRGGFSGRGRGAANGGYPKASRQLGNGTHQQFVDAETKQSEDAVKVSNDSWGEEPVGDTVVAAETVEESWGEEAAPDAIGAAPKKAEPVKAPFALKAVPAVAADFRPEPVVQAPSQPTIAEHPPRQAPRGAASKQSFASMAQGSPNLVAADHQHSTASQQNAGVPPLREPSPVRSKSPVHPQSPGKNVAQSGSVSPARVQGSPLQPVGSPGVKSATAPATAGSSAVPSKPTSRPTSPVHSAPAQLSTDPTSAEPSSRPSSSAAVHAPSPASSLPSAATPGAPPGLKARNTVQRKQLKQEAAVVMPSNANLSAVGVQFGSLGLGGGAVDDEEASIVQQQATQQLTPKEMPQQLPQQSIPQAQVGSGLPNALGTPIAPLQSFGPQGSAIPQGQIGVSPSYATPAPGTAIAAAGLPQIQGQQGLANQAGVQPGLAGNRPIAPSSMVAGMNPVAAFQLAAAGGYGIGQMPGADFSGLYQTDAQRAVMGMQGYYADPTTYSQNAMAKYPAQDGTGVNSGQASPQQVPQQQTGLGQQQGQPQIPQATQQQQQPPYAMPYYYPYYHQFPNQYASAPYQSSMYGQPFVNKQPYMYPSGPTQASGAQGPTGAQKPGTPTGSLSAGYYSSSQPHMYHQTMSYEDLSGGGLGGQPPQDYGKGGAGIYGVSQQQQQQQPGFTGFGLGGVAQGAQGAQQSAGGPKVQGTSPSQQGGVDYKSQFVPQKVIIQSVSQISAARPSRQGYEPNKYQAQGGSTTSQQQPSGGNGGNQNAGVGQGAGQGAGQNQQPAPSQQQQGSGVAGGSGAMPYYQQQQQHQYAGLHAGPPPPGAGGMAPPPGQYGYQNLGMQHGYGQGGGNLYGQSGGRQGQGQYWTQNS
ncbi:hypothetical protein BJ742DRAFT_737247 [Cladochytrium replicatum]|nr:hypothetical protein BJ742DRAFT_737247 [Cladochytrium replicatum]